MTPALLEAEGPVKQRAHVELGAWSLSAATILSRQMLLAHTLAGWRFQRGCLSSGAAGGEADASVSLNVCLSDSQAVHQAKTLLTPTAVWCVLQLQKVVFLLHLG